MLLPLAGREVATGLVSEGWAVIGPVPPMESDDVDFGSCDDPVVEVTVGPVVVELVAPALKPDRKLGVTVAVPT